jgi:hypothetical protein
MGKYHSSTIFYTLIYHFLCGQILFYFSITETAKFHKKNYGKM